MLYLKILARNIFKLAVFVILNKVTCFIDCLGIVFVARILNKCRRGFFGVVVVARREKRASYIKLAHFARGFDKLAAVFHDKNVAV